MLMTDLKRKGKREKRRDENSIVNPKGEKKKKIVLSTSKELNKRVKKQGTRSKEVDNTKRTLTTQKLGRWHRQNLSSELISCGARTG